MKTPDSIFVSPVSLVGYFKENHPANSVQYIRKDALLEWAKERREDLYNWHFHDEAQCWKTFDEFINKLISM